MFKKKEIDFPPNPTHTTDGDTVDPSSKALGHGVNP